MANAMISGQKWLCLGRRQKTGPQKSSTWRQALAQSPSNPTQSLQALAESLQPVFASACYHAAKRMRAANERPAAVSMLFRHHEPPESIFNPDSLLPSTATADGIEVLVVEDNRMQQVALDWTLDKYLIQFPRYQRWIMPTLWTCAFPLMFHKLIIWGCE